LLFISPNKSACYRFLFGLVGYAKNDTWISLVFRIALRLLLGIDFRLAILYSLSVSDVTRILVAIEHGEPKAADQLLPLVYEELRKLAAYKMSHQPPGQTLQATALVHEAYLRLIGNEPVQWNSRGHFFSAAAEAMRRILIERARMKSARKHGGGLQRVDLDQVDIALDTGDDLLLLLNEALEEFREKDPAAAELIKLRFFAGLPNHEAAQLLGVSDRTAKRSWAYARAWLYQRMQDKLPGP
jgi:RNA polymerase sigma factor (TIGR02999 family)